jgi:hypothetical protein
MAAIHLLISPPVATKIKPIKPLKMTLLRLEADAAEMLKTQIIRPDMAIDAI